MSKRDIEFLRVTHLRGPNVWTYRPVLEAVIDIHDLEDAPSNTLPGFYERLSSWLPGLIEHCCSYEERGGFLRRVREGTWPGHILEHVTLELQNQAGMQTGFGKARSVSKRGVYKVVVRTRQPEVSRACMEAARDLVMAAIEGKPFDVPATVARLRDMADSLCLGPSTANIVDAATDRRIPFTRLTDGNLVQLGYGARQRRIWTAETDRTSAIAESISRNKDLTKSLLSACGVPVPEGREVDSPADAWAAAEDIGLPVVVKPTDGNHGRGVATNLRRQENIEAAYTFAEKEGSGVIVERFIEGAEHRILVIGGKVVAATRGETASVTGDGRSTITDLIEIQLNSDPRRGEAEDFPLTPIRLDREPVAMLELRRQGFGPDSVPPAGQEVLVIRHGNMAFDCTDEVHPEVARMASLAARIVGLDIAGLDLVCQDISRPLAEQRGAIVEVNAGPGLLMHLKPAEGKPRPVGKAIVDHLFPEGEDGRIPIVGVSGSKGKTAVAQLVGHLLQLTGWHVGVACSNGLYHGKRRFQKSDAANWSAGQRLLMNRAAEAAVIENGVRCILAEGLAYDRCAVGVVTNLDPAERHDDLYVDTPEQIYNTLRTQVDVVLPSGTAVLNAADPKVAEMAELCDGEVIFFAIDGEHPLIARHRSRGKRAVIVRRGKITLASGVGETRLAAVDEIPCLAGQEAFEVENLLAAVAAAWALDLSTDLIEAGLATFAPARDGRQLEAQF